MVQRCNEIDFRDIKYKKVLIDYEIRQVNEDEYPITYDIFFSLAHYYVLQLETKEDLHTLINVPEFSKKELKYIRKFFDKLITDIFVDLKLEDFKELCEVMAMCDKDLENINIVILYFQKSFLMNDGFELEESKFCKVKEDILTYDVFQLYEFSTFMCQDIRYNYIDKLSRTIGICLAVAAKLWEDTKKEEI